MNMYVCGGNRAFVVATTDLLLFSRFEVTTLGQPLEVLKTQMASSRGDSMATAFKKVWSRGKVLGCESSSFMV
jgi:hypothetical protein